MVVEFLDVVHRNVDYYIVSSLQKFYKVHNFKVAYSNYKFVCNVAKVWLNVSVYFYQFFLIVKSNYISI